MKIMKIEQKGSESQSNIFQTGQDLKTGRFLSQGR